MGAAENPPRPYRGMTDLDWVLFAVAVLAIPTLVWLRLTGLLFEATVVFAVGMACAGWAFARSAADCLRAARMWQWAQTPPPPGTPDH